MKRTAFVVLVLVLWLATCSAPQPEVPAPQPEPTQTDIPATATAIPPTPTETMAPAAKLPAAPFDAEPYRHEEAGFALDIPAGWTVNETVIGPRGTQIQFLSAPELGEADSIPDGQTRLSATIYRWDPKNDLDAYVDHWKKAWSASGFTILEEQELILELGLPAVQFTVQTPETEILYLVTALEDQYLVLGGEGDLDLVELIVQRLRPISN
jgi:hypothetical protein